MVWGGCGGGLSPCVIDRFWRSGGGGLLCLFVFFFLRETCTLFCCVPLSWAAEMAVKLRWVSWVGSVLDMISVIILAVGGGLLRSLI